VDYQIVNFHVEGKVTHQTRQKTAAVIRNLLVENLARNHHPVGSTEDEAEASPAPLLQKNRVGVNLNPGRVQGKGIDGEKIAEDRADLQGLAPNLKKGRVRRGLGQNLEKERIGVGLEIGKDVLDPDRNRKKKTENNTGKNPKVDLPLDPHQKGAVVKIRKREGQSLNHPPRLKGKRRKVGVVADLKRRKVVGRGGKVMIARMQVLQRVGRSLETEVEGLEMEIVVRIKLKGILSMLQRTERRNERAKVGHDPGPKKGRVGEEAPVVVVVMEGERAGGRGLARKKEKRRKSPRKVNTKKCQPLIYYVM